MPAARMQYRREGRRNVGHPVMIRVREQVYRLNGQRLTELVIVTLAQVLINIIELIRETIFCL